MGCTREQWLAEKEQKYFSVFLFSHCVTMWTFLLKKKKKKCLSTQKKFGGFGTFTVVIGAGKQADIQSAFM